jgi:hypothetical protein
MMEGIERRFPEPSEHTPFSRTLAVVACIISVSSEHAWSSALLDERMSSTRWLAKVGKLWAEMAFGTV